MTKLYVGNLPFSATDDAVRALFAKHGTVEKVALITDRETGRPRGFGFVEMATEAQAAEAIKLFDGKQLDGRSLTVNESRPQEKRNNFGGGQKSRNRY